MPPTPLSLSPDRRRPELCRAGAQLRFSFARRMRVGMLATGVEPAAAPGRGSMARSGGGLGNGSNSVLCITGPGATQLRAERPGNRAQRAELLDSGAVVCV